MMTNFAQFRVSERVRLSAVPAVPDSLKNPSNQTMPIQGDGVDSVQQHRPIAKVDATPYDSESRYAMSSSDNQEPYPLQASRKRPDQRYPGKRRPRHSMPTTVGSQKPRRVDPPPNESQTIHEDEVAAFENAHCFRNINVDLQRSHVQRSPPSKFFKQNSNPYPNHDVVSVASSSDASSSMGPPSRPPYVPSRKCPVKPKRLSINSNKSRTLLTEAHFTGAYKNFQVQSPFFAEDSSSSGFPTVPPQKSELKLSGYDTMDSQATRYQVIRNRRGEEVEYAIPCHSRQSDYSQTTSKLTSCATSADSMFAGTPVHSDATEQFQTDGDECERIVNGIYDYGVRSNPNRKSQRRNRRRIPITDLDKSTDSGHTMRESNATSNVTKKSMSPNQCAIWEYYERMQECNSMIISPISEFRPANEESQGSRKTTLFFENGTFKSTACTIRRYYERDDDASSDYNYALVTESAVLHDAEVLRLVHLSFFFLVQTASDDCKSEHPKFGRSDLPNYQAVCVILFQRMFL